MYTWIFERAVCPYPIDGRLYRSCLIRRPALLLWLFPRLLGLLLSLFSEKLGSALRWRFLCRVEPGEIARFWKQRAKGLPALPAASGQIWLTRLPEKAVAPLAELAGAKLFSGEKWSDLARQAAEDNLYEVDESENQDGLMVAEPDNPQQDDYE